MKNSIKINNSPRVNNNPSSIVLERKQSIQTKIFDILGPLKGMVQNRITFLGILFIFSALSLRSQSLVNQEIHEFKMILSIVILMFSMGLIQSTVVGMDTFVMYEKTRKHILKYGTIREEFFKKIAMNNGLVCGYCNTQGVYLAAKEYGIEGHFKELSKKYSNTIIPNF